MRRRVERLMFTHSNELLVKHFLTVDDWLLCSIICLKRPKNGEAVHFSCKRKYSIKSNLMQLHRLMDINFVDVRYNAFVEACSTQSKIYFVELISCPDSPAIIIVN